MGARAGSQAQGTSPGGGRSRAVPAGPTPAAFASAQLECSRSSVRGGLPGLRNLGVH